ncbi:MAG: rhodanese-like domain-containing protein [Acidiferrobacterales bacterium]
MEKSFSDRVAEAKASVSAITATEARQTLESNPEILFIDPRDAADIKATTGMIPGALNVSLKDLADADLPEVLASRSRTIITACQAGPMGALAAHALKQRGFSNVHYLEGGTQGWLDAGYATAR